MGKREQASIDSGNVQLNHVTGQKGQSVARSASAARGAKNASIWRAPIRPTPRIVDYHIVRLVMRSSASGATGQVRGQIQVAYSGKVCRSVGAQMALTGLLGP